MNDFIKGSSAQFVQQMMWLIVCLAATLAVVTKGYVISRTSSPSTATTTRLHMFGNLFGGRNKNNVGSSEPPTGAKVAVDQQRVDQLKGKLEKISRTQNRDYEAEAKASNNYGRTKPVENRDKQTTAFNFNKPNEFPNLYEGWIKADGDQIAKQMIASCKTALGAKERYIELLFDPVPNLGTWRWGWAWAWV